MVRNYKKKRETTINEDDMEKAVSSVVNGTMKLRRAADIFGIKPNTLFYRVKNAKKNKTLKSEEYSSKHTVAQVFTDVEEKYLEKYFLKLSRLHYGLTYVGARKMAYDYAKALDKCPQKWLENKKAGIDWMQGFMKRHKRLSLRKPENTSLSRSTSFNRHNVTQFFQNYEEALKKADFTPDRIYNLDETNVMTVVQAPNVIAETGVKQVGQGVSAERGQLITMCAIVNAIGNTIPPVFVFPRKRIHESMLIGGPPGSLALGNSPKSGWMTGVLFVKVLEHIKKATRCSKDDKILLLLDNHESQCTLDAINYCRQNGIVLVTFPPHCTHKMQPLDVAVNSSFKQKLSVAQNDWLLQHPGRTISIHDLPAIVTPAYNASHTRNNITAGFLKPGIFPLNRNAFTDDDFDCSEVTNRPAMDQAPTSINEAAAETSVTPRPLDQPSTSTIIPSADSAMLPRESNSPSLLDKAYSTPPQTPSRSTPLPSSTTDQHPGPITPEMIRPFPKAPPRKNNNKGRKKGKSRILTDTPEKNAIESAQLERIKRLKKSSIRPRVQTGKENKAKNIYKGKGSKKCRVKLIKEDDSSTESDIDQISLHDDSDMDLSDGESGILQEHDMCLPVNFDCNVGDFVLVNCSSQLQSSTLAFVAKIEEKDLNTFTVNYLKRKGNTFFFPEKEDRWPISILDIVAKLPPPNHAPGTSRTASRITFNFNFGAFKLG